jgi:acetyl-CoA acetyltransferase
MTKPKDISIVAYGETPITLRGGRSSYELAGDVLEQVLDSTGLEKSAIDGLVVGETMSETANPFWGPFVCEQLGLTVEWMGVSGVGGVSPINAVSMAAAAIRDGQCETVLAIASDAQSSSRPTDQGAQRGEFQYPVGLRGPVGVFGLLTERYRHQHELDERALAKLAVTQRNHALLNPNGCEKLRSPITEDDYLRSKFISEPVRILDSVMPCDGANAVLVTSTRNADKLGLAKRVHPTAAAQITNFQGAVALPDITETGFLHIAPKLFARAGMTPRDIRMVHLYDDFLIALLLQFEQLGFCERGRGSEFVLQTDLSFRGSLPLNTSGGQISAGQAGLAGGGTNLVEAVRQMFGEAGDRQVSDPRNALVSGIGVIPYGRNWTVSGALILEQA